MLRYACVLALNLRYDLDAGDREDDDAYEDGGGELGPLNIMNRDTSKLEAGIP